MNKVFKVVDALMAFVLGAMIALVFFNVILRYFFDSGISWSEEMARFMFLFVIYIGAIGAMRDNQHLGMDTVIKRMPPNLQKISFFLGRSIIIVLMVFMLIGSIKLTILNFSSKASATGISYSFIYGMGILTSACIIAICINNMYKVFIDKGALKGLITLHESEDDFETEEQEGE